MTKVKILHVITSLKIGGAERALCTLLQALDQKDFTHHVAYFYDGPCKDILQGLNISTHQINGLVSRYDPFAYLSLKRLVHKLKPDLIHTSLWSANILGRLVGRASRIPVVSDLHGNCIQEGGLRNLLDRWTAHIPFRTIAVADEVKKAYQERVITPIKDIKKRGQACQQLIVKKNGIDPEAIRAQAFASPLSRTELKIASDAFVVGSVGRFEAIKAYDVLIKAFALFVKQNKCPRKPVLLLVGDGTQSPVLQNFVQDLQIGSNVKFTGTRTDAQRFYPLFDCFALSSHSEGLSLALLEALCFGLPIITTNKTMTHEVITDRVNGLIVPPNNELMLAEKIKELYQNPELIDKIRTANNNLVRDKFALSTTIAGYKDVFEIATK